MNKRMITSVPTLLSWVFIFLSVCFSEPVFAGAESPVSEKNTHAVYSTENKTQNSTESIKEKSTEKYDSKETSSSTTFKSSAESKEEKKIENYLVPDQKLRQIINKRLNKPLLYSPTPEELSSITGLLDISSNSKESNIIIKSWEGLQYLDKISMLQVADVETDSELLTYISRLPNITSLILDNIVFTGNDSTMVDKSGKDIGIKQIIDFSPLSNLKKLNSLSINMINTEIKNYTAYARAQAKFSNLGKINTLTNIYISQIGETDDNSFRWLKSLTSLQELTITGTPLNNVTDIGSLENLTYLNINDNQISDFSPIVNKKYFRGAQENKQLISPLYMFSDKSMGKRLVKIDNIINFGGLGITNTEIKSFSSIKNFTVLSNITDGSVLKALIQMKELKPINSYNWKTGKYDKWDSKLKGTCFSYTVTTNNEKEISGYTYLGIEEQLKPEIKVKDSSLKVGESWSPKDNFISAIDENGLLINKFDPNRIAIEGSVDTSRAGIYKVIYKISGEQMTSKITVEEKNETKAKAKDLIVFYQDTNGNDIHKPKILSGNIDDEFNEMPIIIEGYIFKEVKHNSTTKGLLTDKEQSIIFIYTRTPTESKKIKLKTSNTEVLDFPNKHKDSKSLPDTGENTSIIVMLSGIITTLLVLYAWIFSRK